jgi:hypothetical protein
MKRTPRRAETEIAKLISAFSSRYGYQPVKRKPVIGRTGPDIEINELGLVVDVKNRKSVPLSAMPGPDQVLDFGDGLLAVRIGQLELLLDPSVSTSKARPSKTVRAWWEHMDAWKREHYPEGITALAIRRPIKSPYALASFVIHSDERKMLWNRTTN